jgi:hypothetical protein
MTDTRTIPCACGRVELETRGAPFMSAACYCDDCQEATRRIEALPGAKPVKGADGGTEYLLYRKDRVRYSKGAELLQRQKLREGSPTNRWIATCCNSAMSLNFDDAKHWVDVYRIRLAGEKPPLEMRVCTRFKPQGSVIAPGVPQYPGYPFKFIARLIGTRLSMMLGR